MNLIDSSAWLEYFADGPGAVNFHAPLQDEAELLVPTIVIYEVFKVALREAGENQALQAVAAMRKGMVIELTGRLAMRAATLSLQHQLPMADSLILATALTHEAIIWTQDAHFQNLPGVKYFAKQAGNS